MPSSRFQNLHPQRAEQLIAAGLFLLALLTRILGIGWGLPNDLHSQSFHPDEPVNYAVSRNIEPAKLQFTPGFYNYGTLYFTVLRVAGDIAQVYGSAGENPIKQASSGILAGRIVNALAGAGTVLFVFLMLRRFANRFGSFMGALLVAFAPAFVVHSRFATPDVLATFLMAVSLYFVARLLPRDGTSRASVGASRASDGASLATDDAINANVNASSGSEDGPTDTGDASQIRVCILAGAFAGLAAGTKYTGSVALLPLFAALGFLRPNRAWFCALAGLAAAALAFFVSTPGALLDSAAFARDVAFEMGHSATGHGLVFVGYGNGFGFQIGNLTVGVGLMLTILGLVGLLWGAARKKRWAWIALALFVPYYILIGRAEVFFIRYTFPLLIPLALGFGWLMAWAHERKGNALLLAVLGIIAVCGVDFGGLRGAAKFTYWMMSEDTRDEAARYLKEKAGGLPGATVGLASDPWFYTPPLYPDVGLPRFVPAASRDEAMAAASDPKVVYLRPKQPSDPIAWDARLVKDIKPDYIVYSSFEYHDVARLQGRSDVPETAQVQARQAKDFMAALEQAYEPDRYVGKYGVLVHDLEYIRPNIQIWKRKSTPSTSR